MCVAFPMRVTAVTGDRGRVALGDVEQEVSLELLDNVAVGDYVIVHAGFALQTLDRGEAAETLAMLGALTRPEEEPAP
ncbi:MAG TPA: HypC/HybG/HupF family hydrogenase formation chaperone [Planctomycetota bacterium]|nr:HypC/HybG/HupF family hydrogenase formation chaperone [Planctomycetota bacterium]OQC21477.1 MAG: Hydrogenase isoenzymes formation protein HypC [Planctomycetes bacterium ADurb.Bin069]NMD36766.1 HypC/HybG/HupF family hydrogenase formation chaperone [Planctomycetota bacterium]HNR97765.1 HypC/HybG/HupF family hydrogenase formation chaperone [Planctomycetota bacterium]HNU24768.1 HypC/HybG/HupF family hydrogenase formation chaperone [Planctomycetota bacterium]